MIRRPLYWPRSPVCLRSRPSLQSHQVQIAAKRHSGTRRSYARCHAYLRQLPTKKANRTYRLPGIGSGTLSLGAKNTCPSFRISAKKNENLQSTQDTKRFSVFLKIPHPFRPGIRCDTAGSRPRAVYVVVPVPPQRPQLLQPDFPYRPIQESTVYCSLVAVEAADSHFVRMTSVPWLTVVFWRFIGFYRPSSVPVAIEKQRYIACPFDSGAPPVISQRVGPGKIVVPWS